MGGGRHFEYPKWVWSPAGGWWPKPINWQRNTVFYGIFVVIASVGIHSISQSGTVTIIFIFNILFYKLYIF